MFHDSGIPIAINRKKTLDKPMTGRHQIIPKVSTLDTASGRKQIYVQTG